MKLIKVKCVVDRFGNTDRVNRMSDFNESDIKDYQFDQYIDVDYIWKVSEISYKTIHHTRYYGFKVTFKNEKYVWVIANGNNYDCLGDIIKEDNKPVDRFTKKHLNYKFRK